MADNATAPATGLAFATNDIGGVHFARNKLVHGAPGTNAGDVSMANGLPVQMATGAALPLPAGAATDAKLPAFGIAGTASANVITVQGIAGAVAMPVSLAAGSAAIAKAEDVASADGDVGVPAMAVRKATPANTSGSDGDYEMLQVSAGRLWTSAVIDTALPAGANSIGSVVLAAGSAAVGTVQPGNTANTTPWLVTDTPATSGGLSMSKTVSAASTNATSVKASAGQVFGVQAFNTNANARYLKLYNKASAPTVGTDTPVKVITIPGATTGAGAVVAFDKGLAFGTGIAFALTTGAADTDTGAVALSELIVNIDYK